MNKIELCRAATKHKKNDTRAYILWYIYCKSDHEAFAPVPVLENGPLL